MELGLRAKPWYAILFTMSLADTTPALAQGQMGMELGSLDGEAGKAYAQKFAARYKEGIKSSYNGYGYDAVVLTAAAINKAQSTEPAAVQAALRDLGKGGYVGVTGPIVFDDNGQRVNPPYARLKYDSGVVPR